MASFISTFGAVFFDLSVVSLQNLTLSFNYFHISEMWMQFFPLAGWWNHLMVCWLSSVFWFVVSKFFFIKACYCLPSSLRHMLNLQLSPPAFKIFFFFFNTCYEIFSLTNYFVACFCFAAQFPWCLGFDIKLYVDVLIEVFAFIWWLCISLIAMFLQWRMPSCYYIIFLQQKLLVIFIFATMFS